MPEGSRTSGLRDAVGACIGADVDLEGSGTTVAVLGRGGTTTIGEAVVLGAAVVGVAGIDMGTDAPGSREGSGDTLVLLAGTWGGFSSIGNG